MQQNPFKGGGGNGRHYAAESFEEACAPGVPLVPAAYVIDPRFMSQEFLQ